MDLSEIVKRLSLLLYVSVCLCLFVCRALLLMGRARIENRWQLTNERFSVIIIINIFLLPEILLKSFNL